MTQHSFTTTAKVGQSSNGLLQHATKQNKQTIRSTAVLNRQVNQGWAARKYTCMTTAGTTDRGFEDVLDERPISFCNAFCQAHMLPSLVRRLCVKCRAHCPS
jgi:hypothetical protein